jgi:hypothetical protein
MITVLGGTDPEPVVPYPKAEGRKNVPDPPSFNNGIPVCHPGIRLRSANVTGPWVVWSKCFHP